MSRAKRRNKIKITQHARNRFTERALDVDVLETIAEAALTMLNSKSLKFRHQGHTIVASRNPVGEVTIVTAWKNESLRKDCL